MPTVTIHHLEVRFQVSGDDDQAVFTRLFERHINAWARLMRTRQPPENELSARVSSFGSKPSPRIKRAARLRAS